MGRLSAGLVLAAVLYWPASAFAQGVPPGSYLRTCGNAFVQADTLVATWQRVDGYAQQTSLPAVRSCVGDIGNANGALTCNYGRGALYGYAQEWEGRREPCWRMRDRLRAIRYRMEGAPPWEQERLGTRFHEIRERLRQECWGQWQEDE